MTEELHKRLEEAARNYAETVVVIQSDLREEYIKESMLDFKTGASFGYKEAISHIKEYLEKKIEPYIRTNASPQGTYQEGFEDGYTSAINEIINELFGE